MKKESEYTKTIRGLAITLLTTIFSIFLFFMMFLQESYEYKIPAIIIGL
jgi:hypothetical protein